MAARRGAAAARSGASPSLSSLMNSPDTSAIAFEAFGHQLRLSQDPNSKHLGTTVWDASMVFIKFLEKNCRKGRFCSSKLKGKHAIELGAGCGLAGLGMALLGCDVTSTDQAAVLPLLARNIERNTSTIKQANPECVSMGSIKVAELDWGNQDQIKAVGPPFDFIIGTDVVYAEHLLEPLLQTLVSLSGPRTTVLIGYEIRSTTVHDLMIDMWKSNFELKMVSKSKMDPKYQHSSIHLFILEPKAQNMSIQSTGFTTKNSDSANQSVMDEDLEGSTERDEGNHQLEDHVETGLRTKAVLNEWEARRYGSMAARLLKDVKIS